MPSHFSKSQTWDRMRLFPDMQELNKFYNLISTSNTSFTGSKWETFAWNNPERERETQATKELECNTRKRWGDIYIAHGEMWSACPRETYSDWSKSESSTGDFIKK